MTAPMIQNWRDVETLQAAGKLGRFLRTRECPSCGGTGLSGHPDHGVDLCGTCGGARCLPVYANAEKARELAKMDMRGKIEAALAQFGDANYWAGFDDISRYSKKITKTRAEVMALVEPLLVPPTPPGPQTLLELIERMENIGFRVLHRVDTDKGEHLLFRYIDEGQITEIWFYGDHFNLQAELTPIAWEALDLIRAYLVAQSNATRKDND